MLPEGYAMLNRGILTTMRREWNNAAQRMGIDSEEWRRLRVRVGLRAMAAVVTYGVEWNRDLYGTMQREGIWIDGQPYDSIRRPYFKASPVVLDRSMNPLDFVVERAAA